MTQTQLFLGVSVFVNLASALIHHCQAKEPNPFEADLFELSVQELQTLELPGPGSIEIDGFGSVVFGQTLQSDEVFTADWFDVGQYKNELSFKTESILAIQSKLYISEQLHLITQLVAKGVDDFKPEFDWYYLNYDASENWSMKLGRRALPMYYFSEYAEVGYAYPWIRPPANLYWWQVNFFDGAHVSYSFSSHGLYHNISAFYGHERDDKNKELSALYSTVRVPPQYTETKFQHVSEHWNNITGLNWVVVGDSFDLRFVHFKTDLNRVYYNGDIVSASIANGAAYTNGRYRFFGLGGSYWLDNFTFYFDYNFVEVDFSFEVNEPSEYHNKYPTLLLTFTYTFDQWQPYISISQADQIDTRNDRWALPAQGEDDYEQHILTSIGLRYTLTSSTALKIQYDNFNDQGYAPAFWNFHGDSSTVSIGIDFIF